jgi:hypothetical protein
MRQSKWPDRRCGEEQLAMPTSFGDRTQPELANLLARTPFIRNACDLDLIVFLHRHPRTLLTSEQLAGFLGYSLKDTAKALDSFIEVGLLERTTQQSMHAARMFVLLLDGPQAGGIRPLLELGSTRVGRAGILEALKAPGSRTDQSDGRSELRLIKSA